MSRRSLIEMTEAEIDAYLAGPHLCRIGTIGPRGEVHLVAMNYGFVDGLVAFWTYRSAQKTKNLQRNPALSLIVDSGTTYAELKGVSMSGRAELGDDPDTLDAFARSMGSRYGMALTGSTGSKARASASKRVVVLLHPDRIMSWDHTKLGGGY